MKRRSVILTGAMFILTIAAMAFRSPGPSAEKKDIIGTWRLDTYRYGSEAVAFAKTKNAQSHIKLITGNRFMWAIYDSTSKKIIESAGGKYTLDGDNYSETIDFGYNMDSYLGKACKFRVHVSEGMFFMTGYLPDGYKIEEVWRKVE